MKRPQKLAVMLVPTPPYEICGIGVRYSPGQLQRRKNGTHGEFRYPIHANPVGPENTGVT